MVAARARRLVVQRLASRGSARCGRAARRDRPRCLFAGHPANATVTVSPLRADFTVTVPDAPWYDRVPPVIADSSPAPVEVGATPASVLLRPPPWAVTWPSLSSSVIWHTWPS